MVTKTGDLDTWQMFTRADAAAGDLQGEKNRLRAGDAPGFINIAVRANPDETGTSVTEFISRVPDKDKTKFIADGPAAIVGDGTLWGAVTQLNRQRTAMPDDEYTAAILMEVIQNCPVLMKNLNLANASELNMLHIAELVAAFTPRNVDDKEMDQIRKYLSAFGINLKALEHGIIASDYGKFPEGKHTFDQSVPLPSTLLEHHRARFVFATLCASREAGAASPGATSDFKLTAAEKKALREELALRSDSNEKEDDLIIHRISNNSQAVKLLQGLLMKHFGKGSILNPELKPEEAIEIFKKHGILQPFMHELPGLRLLFEKANTSLSEKDFEAAVLTLLCHNGPQEGFWKFLTEKLVPQMVGNDKELEKVFKGGIFWKDGKDGKPGELCYPMPQSTEGILHTTLDRLSQGTGLGAMKILRESGETDLANIALNMFGNNQKNTNLQLKALADHTVAMITKPNLPANKITAYQGSLALAAIAKAMDRIDKTASLVSGNSPQWKLNAEVLATLEAQAKKSNPGRRCLEFSKSPMEFKPTSEREVDGAIVQTQTMVITVPVRDPKTPGKLGFNKYVISADFKKPAAGPIKANRDFVGANIQKEGCEYEFAGSSSNPTYLNGPSNSSSDINYRTKDKRAFDRELFSVLNEFVKFDRAANEPTENIFRELMTPLGKSAEETVPPRANGVDFPGVTKGTRLYTQCTRNYHILQRMVEGFRGIIGTKLGAEAKNAIGDVSQNIIDIFGAIVGVKHAEKAARRTADAKTTLPKQSGMKVEPS